jgi:hypothetical protein
MRTAFALAVVSILAAAPAWADVTYDFIATSDGPAPFDPGSSPPPTPWTAATFSVPDSVVESGSMAFTVNCASAYLCPEPWPSDITGSFAFGGLIPAATPYYQPGSGYPVAVDITFNSDGTLSGNFDILEVSNELSLSGNDMSWSGIIGSDLTNNYAISGYWTAADPVPEPSSLALLLPALGVMFWRRRRAA